MSTETSLFKFKKASTKKIGDFDVMDTSEWTLLIKPQIQDVTLFVHFHKHWNKQELPEQVDKDGNVIQEEVKALPVYEFVTGFIKDDKFITTNKKLVQEQTFHVIHKRYMKNLENLLSEQGYKKDYNNYKGDDPIVPHYYINEKTSEKEIMDKQKAQILARQALANSISKGQHQVDPLAVSTMPISKPVIDNKQPKPLFPMLRIKPSKK